MKKIFHALVVVLLLALAVYLLIPVYIDKYYNDPGAVNARNAKKDAKAYMNTIDEFKRVKHEEDTTIVLINPAYGGDEDGEVCRYFAEKDILLEVAQKVAGAMAKSEDVKVYLMRSGDNTLSKEQRMTLTEILNPDIYIEFELAKDVDAGVFGLSADYYGGYYDYRLPGSRLADTLVTEASVSTENVITGINDNPQLMPIAVNDRIIPATRVYLGYISSDKECNALTSDKYTDNLANGLANGIERAVKIYKNEDEAKQ